jgi:hypothetical protein
MSREARPPHEASSGPEERRQEFLRARGLSEDSDDFYGEPDEPGDEADECRSKEDGGAVIDRDEVDAKEEPTNS